MCYCGTCFNNKGLRKNKSLSNGYSVQLIGITEGSTEIPREQHKQQKDLEVAAM